MEPTPWQQATLKALHEAFEIQPHDGELVDGLLTAARMIGVELELYGFDPTPRCTVAILRARALFLNPELNAIAHLP